MSDSKKIESEDLAPWLTGADAVGLFSIGLRRLLKSKRIVTTVERAAHFREIASTGKQALYIGVNPATAESVGKTFTIRDLADDRNLLVDLDVVAAHEEKRATTDNERLLSKLAAETAAEWLAKHGCRIWHVFTGASSQLVTRLPVGFPSSDDDFRKAVALCLAEIVDITGVVVDTAVTDASRVCRLPGSYHQHTGLQATVIGTYEPAEAPVSLEEAVKGLTAPKARPAARSHQRLNAQRAPPAEAPPRGSPAYCVYDRPDEVLISVVQNPNAPHKTTDHHGDGGVGRLQLANALIWARGMSPDQAYRWIREHGLAWSDFNPTTTTYQLRNIATNPPPAISSLRADAETSGYVDLKSESPEQHADKLTVVSDDWLVRFRGNQWWREAKDIEKWAKAQVDALRFDIDCADRIISCCVFRLGGSRAWYDEGPSQFHPSRCGDRACPRCRAYESADAAKAALANALLFGVTSYSILGPYTDEREAKREFLAFCRAIEASIGWARPVRDLEGMVYVLLGDVVLADEDLKRISLNGPIGLYEAFDFLAKAYLRPIETFSILRRNTPVSRPWGLAGGKTASKVYEEVTGKKVVSRMVRGQDGHRLVAEPAFVVDSRAIVTASNLRKKLLYSKVGQRPIAVATTSQFKQEFLRRHNIRAEYEPDQDRVETGSFEDFFPDYGDPPDGVGGFVDA